MTGETMNPPLSDDRPCHFTKHHGAGNDFLVLLDLENRAPVAVVRGASGRVSKSACSGTSAASAPCRIWKFWPR